MKQATLLVALLILVISVKAQEFKFRENINKDSLFNASIEKLPEQIREQYLKTYNEGDDAYKDFLLFMIAMPSSSKKELIENYENKKAEIKKLNDEYSKLVPNNHNVDIEFEPESKILTTPEQITIKIYKTSDNNSTTGESNNAQKKDIFEVVSQDWNLQPGSTRLEEILNILGWTNQTLAEIKVLLNNANCISIKNGEITTIGFSRSGMGKYFYKLFKYTLNKEQKQAYNNACEYIYYKDNVVLEYGGGAIGPQCFEKE
jgi:hypothetical protein